MVTTAVVQDKFTEFVQELQLDTETQQATWERFLELRSAFSIEGDPITWFICDLYVDTLQTLGNSASSDTDMPGCISLTRLLTVSAQISGISVHTFFITLRNYCKVTDQSAEFVRKIDEMEHEFEVLAVVFERFDLLFNTIVVASPDQQSALFTSEPTQKKSRRAHQTNPTREELRTFTWTLFLLVKAQHKHIASDLGNAHHLSLCCLDWLYHNLVQASRRDLISQSFLDSASSATSEAGHNVTEPIIELLCTKSSGLPVDVLGLKIHWFQPYLKSLINTNKLFVPAGSTVALSDLIDPEVFTRNSEAISNLYTAAIVPACGLDERALLDEAFRRTVYTPSKMNQSLVDQVNLLRSTHPSSQTPKPCVGENDGRGIAATVFLGLIEGDAPTPNENLDRYLRMASSETMNYEALILRNLERWSEEIVLVAQEQRETMEDVTSFKENVKRGIAVAHVLYYAALENVIDKERVILQTRGLSGTHNLADKLLENEKFQKSLFICAAEAAFSVLSPHLVYPWLTKLLSVNALDLVRVVELFLRSSGPSLPREVIKHMSWLEESLLESAVWTCESVLWNLLDGVEIPPYCGVAIDASGTSQSQGPLDTPHSRNHMEVFNSPTAQESLLLSPKVDNDGHLLRKAPSSVCLVFRKLYYMASCRLQDLCTALGIGGRLHQLIWTCLEYVLVNHVGLLRNRHLDTIIMCSVYVMSHAARAGRGVSFAEIIQRYHRQPQAVSLVYKEVEEAVDLAPCTVGFCECVGKRGSITLFYNRTFVPRVHDFARRFMNQPDSWQPMLSPLPARVSQTTSPHQTQLTSTSIKLFMSHSPLQLPNGFSYSVSKVWVSGQSPGKVLDEINQMVASAPSTPHASSGATRALLTDGRSPQSTHQQSLAVRAIVSNLRLDPTYGGGPPMQLYSDS